MTHAMDRRAVLRAAALAAAAMMAPTAQAQQSSAKPSYEFLVKDIVYSHSGGKPRLARLYQPAGAGPFPAVLQVHGGAWNNKDRTDGQNTALDFAAAGIVVLSIDFRNAPEAPYPASLQDINYGIRWLKAHARDFGSSAERVGAYGTSTGGHQILLAAMRPDDPRYRALPLAEAPDMDAKLAFVISGWGVLDPLVRQKLAAAANNQDLLKNHATFFRNDETQAEATPARALERGEKLFLPPALVFQGNKDQWVPVEVAEELANRYRAAGGTMDLLLLDGERHTFLNEHPFAKNSVKAFKAVVDFIKKHGSEKHAAR